MQRPDTESSSASQERRSTTGNPSLTITKAEDTSVVNALSNAVAYRETRCRSIHEVLKYCSPATSPVPKIQTESGQSDLPSELLHPEGPQASSSRPYLRSPRLYHSKTDSELRRFKFPFKKFRAKSRSENTHLNPILGAVAKGGFLMGAFNNAYTVESVSTSLLKENPDKGEMFIPTHTVIVLGEIGVGKSALCRTFFRSGIDAEGGEAKIDYCDYLDSPTASSDSDGCYDDHHVYERPVNVDGQCTRIRILDINAMKHRMECGDSMDFEPYLEVGDAYAIVYSIADRQTFNTALDILSRMSELHSDRSLPIIAVGNKCDQEKVREVSAVDGLGFACKYGAKFKETSVPCEQNVIEVFEGVIQQIRLRRHARDPACSPNAPGTSSQDFEGNAPGTSSQDLEGNAPGTSSQDLEGIAGTSITEEDGNSPNKSSTKSKRRSGSFRKVRRRIARRVTGLFGGGEVAGTSKDD